MPTPAADRMRRMRERRRAQQIPPILYERADWKLFLDPQTLPQKAGCEPDQIGRVVVKELVDNALDSGASEVTLTGDSHRCTVSDNGPGLAPQRMLRVFAVNRELVSSKLVRLPTRGMLGNGLRVVMGAVAAFGGTISVTTRGHTYELAPDSVTGATQVISSAPARDVVGLAVVITFPRALFTDTDFRAARVAIGVAASGTTYTGRSLPSWYSPEALRNLLAAAPQRMSLATVIADAFGITGTQPEKTLEWAAQFIAQHSARGGNVGEIGAEVIGGHYRKVTGQTVIDGATVPFCVEAWVTAETVEKDENTYTTAHPLLNRSPCLAPLYGHADSTGLRLYGRGLDLKVKGPKRAYYDIDLSVITPYLRLTGDGKAPFLGDFREAIEKAIGGAAREAYHQMIRPPSLMTLKDASYALMKDAYMKASGDGALPAKARQIMYAARGDILRLTSKKKFDDSYFTQVLLPDYINENIEETAKWDIVYDARGNLTEPHTDRRIPLGTIQVRTYLGERAPLGPAVQLNGETLYPTSGAENRYHNVLFVEKEGFDELFEAVQLAERYDLAIMSTKGMSVVAARKLIDHLANKVDHIFVLRDFDVSGFSIFGTLATDSRRYTFENDMSDKVIDLGLRLEDIEEMGLEAETVSVKSRETRRGTLERHGATEEEIEFLAPEDEDEECRRVELNAMTSPQLVAFVERKLDEYAVAKVVPEDDVIKAHARRLIERTLTEKAIEEMARKIQRKAKKVKLPTDLADRIGEVLAERPALSWDQATAEILDEIIGRE